MPDIEVKSHATLLRTAIDTWRTTGGTVKDFSKELQISPVRLYEMIHRNFVPFWHWQHIEKLSERLIRQEDFLYGNYTKPVTQSSNKSATKRRRKNAN